MNEASQPSTARRKISFLFGFALYFAALWLLWETPFIYPLKIFVVLLHEISHGIASVATGGVIEKIVLDPQQGGACHCGGGNAFVTLTAGYLGSLLWGVALLSAASAQRISNRLPVFLMGAMVVLLTALFIKNSFGLAFGLAFGAALLVAGHKLGQGVNKILLTALGPDQLPVRHLGYQERRARPAPPAVGRRHVGGADRCSDNDLGRDLDRSCPAGQRTRVPAGVSRGLAARGSPPARGLDPPAGHLYHVGGTHGAERRTIVRPMSNAKLKEVINCLVLVPSPTRQGQAIAASADSRNTILCSRRKRPSRRVAAGNQCPRGRRLKPC